MTTDINKSPLYASLHTDGACKRNPGPGGWAFILRLYSEGILIKQIEKSGYLPDCTNNIAELTAMREGLKACPSEAQTEATSDAEYVILNGKERLPKWEANGWRTANKKPVKNKVLWVELAALIKEKEPSLLWVRGHSGNTLNERADELANAASYGITIDETTNYDSEGNTISNPLATAQDEQE